MGKVIRYILIALGVLIAGLLAAPLFIDVNVYKNQIEQRVADATGRQLSIGNIDASLFPWVGIELDDVHLANRRGFSEHDFIRVERLHVKLALLPLLSKRLEIEHFEIVKPVLYLERHADGTSNWADLVASKPAGNPALAMHANVTPTLAAAHVAGDVVSVTGSAPSSAAPLLAALQAESLSLTGGQLTWVDGDATPVVLSELDVGLDDVQLERPVALRVSGKLSGNAFELNANVGPVGDPGKIDVGTLPLQGHFKAEDIQLRDFQHLINNWPAQLGDLATASVRLSARLEQRPDGIRLGEGEVALHAAHDLGLGWKLEMPNADQLKINHVALAVDGMDLLEVKGSVAHLNSVPTFNMRLDSHAVERVWLQGLLPDLKPMYAAHPAAWKQVKVMALLAGSSERLDVRDLQLKLDNELLKVVGKVVYAGPDVRLRMTAQQLHLDAWLPQSQDEAVQATRWQGLSWIREAVAAVEDKPAVEPDLRFLKGLRVDSQLKVKRLFMRGMQMDDFSAYIQGRRGQYKLSPLSFRLAGGKVVEKASINVNTYPVTWKESVHIASVQAGPLLKTLADVDMLEGSMDMDTRFRATGLTSAAVASLNGRGTVLFRDGKVKGFDIAGAIRKYTNPQAYKAGPQETDFAQLSGSFIVRNGIADNQDLFLASPLLRVNGKGTINLIEKTLDYEAKPRVVGTLKGQGDSFLRRGLSIPMHIYGPFASPKIKPIINAKTLIENAPALLGKGVNGIGGTLGKFLGAGSKAPASPSAPAPAPPVSPEKQLLKGLGGLIPGL